MAAKKLIHEIPTICHKKNKRNKIQNGHHINSQKLAQILLLLEKSQFPSGYVCSNSDKQGWPMDRK